VCAGFCVLLVGDPSPKFHEYDMQEPSESVQPPVKLTASGAVPDVVDAAADAVGGLLMVAAGVAVASVE